ncbi:ribose phosphate diphosphokinase [Aureococcus anophagefferens]|uniref:ribose-phosphate diphosphokinase n=1 Tax=Aureococcus anophagefferens TaxID=44056 RepID=A0ABR1FQB4_AURAN
MKFGADLKNSIVPEWQHGYIAYDELKRLIKELSSLEGGAKESAEEDFFMMLEDELEKVNRFYLEKIQEFDGELRALEGRPRSDSNSARGGGRAAPGEVFKSERLDACLEKFKATRSQLSSDVGALEMKLISGSANKPLAEEISARLGVPLSPAKVRRFNDGEVNIQLCDSVRGCDVYIVQPTCPPVNDHLVELLLLIQGFFGPRTPVDNLFAAPIAVTYFNMKDLVKPVIVSPDAGGVARAKLFMEGFSRLPDPPGGVEAGVVGTMHLVGSVEGCDCIIVDDMIDTAGTLTAAANELRNRGKRACVLEECVVANTVPLNPAVKEKTRKIRQVSVGKLVESAIRGIHAASVSALFNADLGADLLA